MKNKLLKRNYLVITLICQLLFVGVMQAQTSNEKVIISGKVTDTDNNPLISVNVYVKGTQKGTLTDFDGNFSMEVAKGSTVVFSYIGFQTVEREITRGGDWSLTMTEDEGELNEVVITALGLKRERKSVGYAIQTLKGEEIALSAEPNIVRNLSGKIAGLQVTGGTSGLGGSSSILIRGNNSLNGNNMPLFIIDDVPMFNDENEAQSFWDATRNQGSIDYGDPISKLNAEDIEEISILKGAGATALYGARASNGVILITTKRGKGVKKGGIGIDYTLNTAISNPMLRQNFQQEYGAGNNGQYDYTGDRNNPGNNELSVNSWGPRFGSDVYLPQFRSPRVDGIPAPIEWKAHPDNLSDFLRTGILQEHSLGVAFNGDVASGRISLRHADESGMVPETDEKRTSLNSSLLSDLSDKWKAELTVNYTESASDNRVPGFGQNMVQNIMRMPSNFDMRYINSVPHKRPDGSQVVFTNFSNPYWTLKEDFGSYKRRNVLGRFGLRYEITDWLEARASISKNLSNAEYRNFTQVDQALTNAGNYFNDGAYAISTNTYTENNYDFMITGRNNITDDIDVSYTAGANRRETYAVNWSASVPELATPNLANLNNGIGTKVVNQSFNEKQTQSVFGIVSFGYKDFLYTDFTGRNTWSSTLPANNRSYFYPSASVSFLPIQAFEIDSKIVNFAKVRGSWSQVGSDTSPYQLTGTYSTGLDWNGRQTNGYTGTLPPTNLKPQRINSLEFGGELGLFNNRISMDIAYYKTNAKNQIVSVEIPRFSGYSRALINAGNIENEGVELNLTASPIKTDNFQWDINVNAARNKTSLVELHPDIEFIRVGWLSMETRVTAGDEYGEIYGYSYIENEEGRRIIQDNGLAYRSQEYVREDGTRQWDRYLGNMQPDWIGGLSNSVRYKNFNLSATLSARFGGLVYSASNIENLRRGLTMETVGLNDRGVDKRLPVSEGGGVRADGVVEIKDTSGNVTGYAENETYVEAQEYYNWEAGIHERHLFDASYIKLQDVSLTYRFTPEVVKSLKYIQGMTLSLTGYNLAVLKGSVPNLDPEVSLGRFNAGQGLESGALPSARRFGLRLNIKF